MYIKSIKIKFFLGVCVGRVGAQHVQPMHNARSRVWVRVYMYSKQ